MDTSAGAPPSASGVYSVVAEWTNATLHLGCSGVFWDMPARGFSSPCYAASAAFPSIYGSFTQLYHAVLFNVVVFLDYSKKKNNNIKQHFASLRGMSLATLLSNPIFISIFLQICYFCYYEVHTDVPLQKYLRACTC